MTSAQKIIKNGSILIISRIILSILSVFVSVLLVRHIGVANYGKYSIVFAYLSFFQILTSFGIDVIAVKEIAKDTSKQSLIVSNAVIMKLIFSVFAMLFSWIVLQFAGYQRDINILIYVVSLSMLFSFNSIYLGLFQVQLKVLYYSVVELVVNTVFSGLVLLFIAIDLPLFYFVALQASLIVPISIASIYFSRKIDNFRFIFKIDFALWKLFLREAWPIFLGTVFVSINSRIDQIILYKYLGDKELGAYAAIVKLTESFNFIPMMFMSVVFPVLSNYFYSSKSQFNKVYNLSFKYMSIFIIPIAFGAAILSEQLIMLIYGYKFLYASTAFSVLIWSSVFIFLGVVNANIFNASGLQKHIFYYTMIGGTLNIILNLILIPRYGILGASISTVISYGINPTILIQLYIKQTRDITMAYIKSTIKPIISSIPMAIFLSVSMINNLYILIFGSVIIYLSFLVIVKGFDNEDLKYFKSVMKIRKDKNKTLAIKTI